MVEHESAGMPEHIARPDNLEPWGRLISGSVGLSKSRLAEVLGVTPAVIAKIAKPCGRMKIPYRSEFDVYDPSLAQTLANDPRILAGRARRLRRDPARSRQVAAQRRAKLTERLWLEHGDGSEWSKTLIAETVERVWSPAQEKGSDYLVCVACAVYRAIRPRPGAEQGAIEVAVNSAWAIGKPRTWKVTDDGDQEEPLLTSLVSVEVEDATDLWMNALLASIRHTFSSSHQEREISRKTTPARACPRLSAPAMRTLAR